MGYPEAARDEAPTWIASAALRQEMLGEWPVSLPVTEAPREVPVEVVAPVIVDRWLVEELPVAPLDDAPAFVPEREPEPVPVPVPEPEPEPVPEPEPEPEPEPDPEVPVVVARERATVVVLTRSFHGTARYTLDPLAEAAPRRRFARGGREPVPTVEVPARPAGVRALPTRRPSA